MGAPTRSFLFDFGPASDLSQRVFAVYNIDGPAVTVHSKTYAGSTVVSDEIEIGAGRHKAVLVDYRDQGVSRHQQLVFDGLCEWPTHAGTDCNLRVLSAEEMSSSSSSLSSSSSTSSSSSSSSSSSLSSSSSTSSSLSSSSSS